MKIAVYSANYGQVDAFTVPPKQTIPCDFLVFGSDEKGWNRRRPPDMQRFSNLRQSRIPKCLSTTLLPEYDVTIWLCGLCQITTDMLVEWCLHELRDKSLAVMRHDDLRTIESEMVASCGYPDREYLGGQRHYYQLQRIDMDLPVSSCNLIIRRRHPLLSAMENEWLVHQLLFCSNDQISLPAVLSRHQVPWRWIEGSVLNALHWTRSMIHTASKGNHHTVRSQLAGEL